MWSNQLYWSGAANQVCLIYIVRIYAWLIYAWLKKRFAETDQKTVCPCDNECLVRNMWLEME